MTTIYKGQDNPVKLILRQGSTAFDLSNYTKIELVVSDSITYDTTNQSSYFEISTSRTGLLILRLGQSNLDVGSYTPEIIYYDADNSNGISFDTFDLEVK